MRDDDELVALIPGGLVLVRFVWRFWVSLALGMVMVFTLVTTAQAVNYRLYDDTVYKSQFTCQARARVLQALGLFDDFYCAKGYTQWVRPQRYGMLLYVCWDEGCGGSGSWSAPPVIRDVREGVNG